MMLTWIGKIWNRVTAPDSKRGKSLWFFPKSDAGPVITHESALTQATVWACVRVIAESISQLPWRCMERTEKGNRVLDTHPADRILYSSPNQLLTPAVWKELVMHDVLLWGNSYHEIAFDNSYRPLSLHRISPDRVTPYRSGEDLWYLIKNETGDDAVLRASEMFHVRGLGDEISGWSVINHALQAIGLATAQDQSMSSLIANGSRPAGIITPAGTMSDVAAERLREEWEANYGGSKNKGKTALLSHAMKYEPLGMPNTDAQMLESRKFSAIEICRFFRVPPHKVMDLERATFSNIEHQAIEFVQDTLVPWCVKLEQEANRKLIANANRGRIFTKFNFNALLRGDFGSRAKGYQMLMDRGVYSINDVLELEDRNTIGPDGDIRLVPLNMQSLEQANEPPKPPEPVPVPPNDPNQPLDPGQDNMAAIYRPLLLDALDRITARECRLLERDKHEKWVDNGHRGYILNQLMPHAAAISHWTGKAVDFTEWAERRCVDLRSEIHAHLAAGGEVSELVSLWADRIDSTTDRLLGV